MATETKQVTLTEEELQELRNLQKANQDLRAELASIGLAKINIAEREAQAANFARELRAADAEMGKKLQEAYGDAEINLESGAVIPKVAPEAE